MDNHKFRSRLSSRYGSLVKAVVVPCLGLTCMTLSFRAEAQIRMVSPNGLAFTEPDAVAQYGGFTAIGGHQDGIDKDGNGTGDDYRGGVYLYEWGNLRLNYVPRGPEFELAFLGDEVRLSNTWLAASAPGYNQFASRSGLSGAVLLAKKVGSSYGPSFNYIVRDARIAPASDMPIAVSDTHLVVGAPRGTTTSSAGAAFVFSYNATTNTWGSPVIITPTGGHANDQFGASVSIDGNRIVVGSPSYDDNLTDGSAAKGRAFIFDRSGAQWLQTFAYTALDATPEARYGAKVDLSGDRIIVSAPEAAGIGLVQILERDGAVWRPRYIDYKSALSVAIQGDKAIIGLSAYPAGSAFSEANRVRTYRLQGSTWNVYGGMVGKDPGDGLGGAVDINSDQVAVVARGFDWNGRSSVGAAYLENFWGTSAGL